VLPIQTLSSGFLAVIDGALISLSVLLLDHGETIELRNVLTVDEIPLQAAAIPTETVLKEMRHLQGVELRGLKNKFVGLLIGLGNPALFRPLDGRYGEEEEPDALLTVLDWTLFGSSFSRHEDKNSFMHVSSCFNKNALNEKSYSPYDTVLSCGLKCANSAEYRIALELMKNSVKLIDGHF